jgi:hypothetical protein
MSDRPGYFPDGPRIAAVLLAAGADIDARTTGRPGETPLHWAASTDDLDVAEVLVEAGADLEAPNGSIGSPLANAIGYGCWHVARLLVARGARVDELWQAAAMGMLSRVEELLAAGAMRRQAPEPRPRATAARAEATASSVLPGSFTRIHAWSPTTLNP